MPLDPTALRATYPVLAASNLVILLEGKRVVRPEDQPRLVALARLLATAFPEATFRSGNAEGADQFFAEGVASVDAQRLQVITPYAGHRRKTNLAYDTIDLSDLPIVSESEVVYQSKSNKKTANLIDRFVAGQRDRYTIKAAYILRDTVKAIGTSDIPPATIGIFYDDLANPRAGGTGHTMHVCWQNAIAVIDQQVWFGWLAEA